jgi:hypothetical protein
MVDIEDWIREQLKAGYTPETIRKSLLNSGYNLDLVRKVLAEMSKTPPTEMERKGKPKIFWYLVLTVVFVGMLLLMIIFLIWEKFPIELKSYYAKMENNVPTLFIRYKADFNGTAYLVAPNGVSLDMDYLSPGEGEIKLGLSTGIGWRICTPVSGTYKLVVMKGKEKFSKGLTFRGINIKMKEFTLGSRCVPAWRDGWEEWCTISINNLTVINEGDLPTYIDSIRLTIGTKSGTIFRYGDLNPNSSMTISGATFPEYIVKGVATGTGNYTTTIELIDLCGKTVSSFSKIVSI